MIAVDWGGTSLRAYRLDGSGRIVAQRRAGIGALDCGGRFAETLAAQIAGWDDAQIVLCGVIGGRGGWHEMPYLDCPADARALAAAMRRIDVDTPLLHRRALHFVPGMIDRRSSTVADVMRGEETQIAGLLHEQGEPPDLVCLPGTHSKWVRLHAGRIESIATAMTGEIYALLRRHSILAQLMAAEESALDDASFDAGLRRSGDAGGLLHHVFGVRTQGLLGQLTSAQQASCLSGLLIGHELRALGPRSGTVHLIANDRLACAYSRALAAFDIEPVVHSESLAAIGMFALAQAAR